MIDFHCHLLHGIDDGSRNLETSIDILKESAEQGVKRIVATPHFYAWEMSIDSFLSKRQAAYDELRSALRERGLKLTGEDGCTGGLPELMLGAEVAFFDNMAASERIHELAITGTDIIMVEMPFIDWEEHHLKEIAMLADKFTVIIAHIERFMTRGNRKGIGELLAMSRVKPIKIQVNAGAFENRRLRRRLMKMFASGEAHMLGSDCHGMHRRPPNLAAGAEAIRGHLGEKALDRIYKENEELIRGSARC